MNRFLSLKDNFLKNKILVENFTFLSALHVTNLLLFFITIPYLFRILGSRNYGLVVFAQTIAFYFSIFVNFGFNLTATRDISVNRNNSEKVNEIVSSVLTLKSVFFLISLAFMALFTLIVPPLRDNRWLFLFSMLACLSEALFPVWYFQGIEKMKYITFINVATRVLATALIFIIINSAGDYFLYPLILGIGTITGAVIALIVVFSRHHLAFRFQEMAILKRYYRENLLYFFSNVSTQIYVNANKVIIGSFLGMVEVAYYDVAEKVINIVKVPYSLIGQTLFPRVAKDRNPSFLKKILALTVLATVLGIILIFFSSGQIIRFFSGFDNGVSTDILRILSVSLLPISVGLFFGDLILINFGLREDYIRIRLAGLFLYLLLFLAFYLTDNLSAVYMSIIIVAVEFLTAGYSFLVYRNKIRGRFESGKCSVIISFFHEKS